MVESEIGKCSMRARFRANVTSALGAIRQCDRVQQVIRNDKRGFCRAGQCGTNHV